MPDAASIAGINPIALATCPQCAYSLQGLPPNGRCPECGYEYDERTFMLRGIPRGLSTTSPGRVVLWVFVGVIGTIAPQVLVLLFVSAGWAPLAIVGIVWLGVIAYLLLTSSRERKGMETFLFGASGFGPCAMDGQTPLDATMTTWSGVNLVDLKRIGPTWHRLRIGLGDERSGRFALRKLDAGVRCTESEAQWIHQALRQRIAASKLQSIDTLQ